MDALWKRHPETRFVWSVPIRFFTVRTDATTLMPYQYGCTKLSNADAKELKHLVDMVCIDFGHMGINDLSFLEYMPNLEYLILVECDIQDITPLGSLKKLKYLELFMNRVTDISALSGCESLRDVNICFNPITDISPLYEIETLENIWASGLACPYEQIETLIATFPNANMLTHPTHSSTAYGWRKIPGYYEQRDLLGMWYTSED
jgi:Leucine-rich repeat (LRR) protein